MLITSLSIQKMLASFKFNEDILKLVGGLISIKFKF